MSVGLEIDHIKPFAEGGPASFENLVRLCRRHHHQKTHEGFRLERVDAHQYSDASTLCKGAEQARWAWRGPPDTG